MNEINLVDTTLRDGDQSVWGMRMTTGMMVPILSDMDRVGFSVIDYMSSAQFKNCISNLREDVNQLIELFENYRLDTNFCFVLR